MTARVSAKHPTGLPDSASAILRRELMTAITAQIRERGWSQSYAASVAGITAPRMSDLTRGKLEKFSLDALVGIAFSFGISLSITTNAKS